MDKGWPQECYSAHIHSRGQSHLGEFFVEDDLLNHRRPATTVFLRPPDADPATFVELLMPHFLALPTCIWCEVFIFPAAHICRHVGLQPRTDMLTKLFFFRGIAKIHWSSVSGPA